MSGGGDGTGSGWANAGEGGLKLFGSLLAAAGNPAGAMLLTGSGMLEGSRQRQEMLALAGLLPDGPEKERALIQARAGNRAGFERTQDLAYTRGETRLEGEALWKGQQALAEPVPAQTLFPAMAVDPADPLGSITGRPAITEPGTLTRSEVQRRLAAMDPDTQRRLARSLNLGALPETDPAILKAEQLRALMMRTFLAGQNFPPAPNPLGRSAPNPQAGTFERQGQPGWQSSRAMSTLQDPRLGPNEVAIPLVVPGNESVASEVQGGETDAQGRPVPGGQRLSGRAPTPAEFNRAIEWAVAHPEVIRPASEYRGQDIPGARGLLMPPQMTQTQLSPIQALEQARAEQLGVLPLPPEPPYTLAPGATRVNPQAGTSYTAPKPEAPYTLAPGATRVNPETGTSYTAPGRPAVTFDALVARANDLTLPPADRAQAQAQATAVQRAHLERAAASRVPHEGKLVGELGHLMVNQAGDYAPFDLPVKDAARSGYQQLTSKEESILHQMPTAITMLGNLMKTAQQLRDAGGTRSAGGVQGLVQRGVISAKQFGGDVTQVGGLLNTWAGQKSELISLYRQLGEKGNIAARVLAPQLDALSPAVGFPAIARMLGMMKQQLLADVRQSRVPGFAAKLPQIPDALSTTDPRYIAARQRGLTDQQIEQQFGILLVPTP